MKLRTSASLPAHSWPEAGIAPPRPVQRRARQTGGSGKALFLLPIAAALLAATTWAPAQSVPAPAPGSVVVSGLTLPEPPPPPPGYQSPAEVTAALALKQITPVNLQEPLPEGVVETKGIEYGNVQGRSLQLDLYQPAGLEGRVPGLIFIHGGAWSGGSRQMYRYYTLRFAQRGYVAATISYRLSGEAPFPAAVEDAKCAVRWLRANAATYHVDPDRIAVIGGSAGGHLAMMVGYAADVPELEGQGGHAGVSSRVAAVVDLYGPYDLTTEFARKAGPVRRFLGGKTYDQAPELYRRASPRHYLHQGAPPTLILHGTIDDVVPIAQSDALAARLAELGVPYVYDRLAGWPHAMDLAQSVNERCQWFMSQFFEQVLRSPK